jgi:hypothetical protein
VRYVLHIGLPKTGSTSLQAFLSGNAAALREGGVIYPGGEGYPHSRQHSWIVGALDEPGGKLSQLLGECRGHDAAVISGEYLTNLSPAQVQALRRRLIEEGEAGPVLVILYVRNLADLVLALCAEWVKLEGRAYHETVIQTWEGVFGEASMDVRLLEAARPSLEQDFCRAAGLPWRDDYLRPPRRNPTADPLSAQLLRLLDIEFGKRPGHRAVLQTSRKLPRLENHYLQQIAQVIGRVDLSHPKLARFADQLTAINWRDEAAGPNVVEYLNGLIAGLLQVRNHALAAAKAGDAPARPD